jgi:small subunit ribosomal protein S20
LFELFNTKLFLKGDIVANSAQAKKRARQAEKHRQHNMSLRSKLRTSIKKVVNTITAGNKVEAQAAFKIAEPVIDVMVGKGIIHKNKAARHKSRLNARILAMQSS